mgnify:CR=1 FL=1
MMRRTPIYLMEDPAEVKRLVRAHPWATIVSATDERGLIASHYPVLLDEDSEQITLLSHVGRPDDQLHELGRHEVLLIIQGAHDYVSASWYEAGDNIPTWNHVTAHPYGTPEILSDDANFGVLDRLTNHFEQGFDGGRSIREDEALSRRIAKGTVGIRIPITRFDARAKLSQNRRGEVAERIIDAYEVGGATPNPELAAEMRRVHGA